MGRASGLIGVIGTALVVLPALAGCSDPEAGLSVHGDQVPSSAPTEPITPADEDSGPAKGELMLRFGEVGPGAAPSSFVNSGQAPLKIGTVTWGTGRVAPASSLIGRALRLPAYAEKDAGFAILSVVNDSEPDVLSPGDSAFTFGADFTMDEVTTGTPSDDGDNLVQRGLFEGSSQYKIQIDEGRVSCRVRGFTGEVVVSTRGRVDPSAWYRVRCTRSDSTVTLQVGEIPADGGDIVWRRASRSASIGSVLMPGHTPLSIGGKLAADGTILPSSTDQFNGAVDRVFFRVLP